MTTKKLQGNKVLALIIMVAIALGAVSVSAKADSAPPALGNEIIAFSTIEAAVAHQTVPPGTPEAQLQLPQTLEAAVQPIASAASASASALQPEQPPAIVQVPVQWVSAPAYNSSVPGSYVFSAVLSGYALHAQPPAITVVIEPSAPLGVAVKSFAALNASVTSRDVAVNTTAEQLGLPAALPAVIEQDGESISGNVPVSWASHPAYNPAVPGQYSFTPTVAAGYHLALDEGAHLPVITVQVTMPFAPTADISSLAGTIRAYSPNLTVTENGSALTVTGTVYEANSTLLLDINSGVTIFWEAEIIAKSTFTGTLVHCTGSGNFTLAGNGLIEAAEGTALASSANITLTGNSLIKTTGNGTALSALTAGTVITLTDKAQVQAANGVAVYSSTAASVLVGGSAIVRGGSKGIHTQGPITVSGNSQVVAVSASGIAIENDDPAMSSDITINGGTVFAKQPGLQDTANAVIVYGKPAVISGDGLVLAWDTASYNPSTPYATNSSDDLSVIPGGDVYWAKREGGYLSGIWYSKGINTGFIPLDVNLTGRVKLQKSDFGYTLPSGLVYNGSPQGITSSISPPVEFDSTLTVYYEGSTYSKSTTAPTDAGTYTISLTTTGGTKYEEVDDFELGSYTIAKAPAAGVTLTTPPAISVFADDTGSKTLNLSTALSPSVAGGLSFGPTLSYGLGTLTNAEDVLGATPTITGSTLYYIGGGKSSGTATLVVWVHSTNFESTHVPLTFNGLQKPTATVSITIANNMVYGGTLTPATATATDGGGANIPDASFVITYGGTIANGQAYTDSANMPTKPGSYTVTAHLESATHQGTATQHFSIAKKELTWSTGTAKNKIYDGSTIAEVDTANGGTPVLQGILPGDSVTVTNGNLVFAGKDVQLVGGTPSGVAVTASAWGIDGAEKHFYEPPASQPLFAPALILPKEITFTATPTNRPYNGSTTVQVALSPTNKYTTDSITLTATGELDSANAGSGKAVTLQNVVLSGTHKNNYVLNPANYPATTATITKATSGLTFTNPVSFTILTTNTNENQINLESVLQPVTTGTGTATGAVSYVLQNNFTNTAGILTAKPEISPDGTAIVYTGTGKTSGTASISVLITSENYSSQTVTLDFKAVDRTPVTVVVSQLGATYGEALPAAVPSFSPAGSYPTTISYSGRGTTIYAPSPDAPTEPGDYTVTVTINSPTHKGSGSANFTIGKIQLAWDPAPMAVNSRPYNGTTTATATLPVLQNVRTEHATGVSVRAGNLNFTSKNAGTDIPVTATSWGIQGDMAKYYIAPVNQPACTPANITPLPLTATATAANREYNGSSSVQVGLVLGNVPSGEGLTLTATGTMDDANAGVDKTVHLSNISLNGTSQPGNYIIPTQADIGPVLVTIHKASSGFVVTRPKLLFIPKDDTGLHNVLLTSTFNLQTNLPAGTVTHSLSANGFTDHSSILASAPSLSGMGDATALSYQGNGKLSGSATQAVTITSTNYVDIQVTLTFVAINNNEVWYETSVDITLASLSVTGNSIEYGESFGTPAVEVKDGSTILDASQYTVEYSYEGVDIRGNLYGPSATPPVKPGSYTITAELTPASKPYYGSNTQSFTITKRQLGWNQIGTVNPKVYSGDTTTSFATNGKPLLARVIGTDNVTAVQGSVQFFSPNANPAATVISNGWGMQGSDKDYYLAPPQPTFHPAEISKKQLTASLSASSRQYNGTTTVSVTVNASGIVSADQYSPSRLALSFSEPCTVATPDAENGKIVSYNPASLQMTGSSKDNYIMPVLNPAPVVTMNITKAVNGFSVNTLPAITLYSDELETATLEQLAQKLNPRATTSGQETGSITYSLSTFANSAGVLKAMPVLNTANPDNISLSYTGNGKTSGQTQQTIVISSDNFQDKTITLTFNAADKPTSTVTVTPPADMVYGDAFNPPSASAATNSAGNSTFLYYYEGVDSAGIFYPKSTTPPTKPGTYNVVAKIKDGTHQGSSPPANFSISRKYLSWDGTGTVTDKTYDGSTDATALSFPTLTGWADPADEALVTIARGAVSFGNANAGSQTVSANMNWNNNLTGTTMNYYFAPTTAPVFENGTINPKPILIDTATLDEKFYDGSSEVTVQDITLSGVLPASPLTRNIDYAVEGNFDTPDVGSNKTVTIMVELKNTAHATNYVISNNGLTLANQTVRQTNINEKTVEVTITGNYIYNGSAAVVPPANIEVRIDGRQLVHGTDFTFSYTSGGTNAGPVDILIQGIGNYSGNIAKSNSFTVQRRKVTVKANNITLNAGDPLPTFTYSLLGALPGEIVFSGTAPVLSCTAKNTATPGTYDIKVDLTGTNYTSNYEADAPAFAYGTLTIKAVNNGNNNNNKDDEHTTPASTPSSGTSKPASSAISSKSSSVITSGTSSLGSGVSATGSTAVSSAGSSAQQAESASQGATSSTGGNTSSTNPVSISSWPSKQETLSELTDGNVPTLQLFGNSIPFYAFPHHAVWSIANVLLSFASAAAAVWVVLQAAMKRRKGTISKYKILFLLAGLGTAIASLVLLFTTQRFNGLMVLTDPFTLWFAILFGVQLILLFLSQYKKSAKKTEQ